MKATVEKAVKRIAVLGGSFDPPSISHLQVSVSYTKYNCQTDFLLFQDTPFTMFDLFYKLFVKLE